jgi:actin
MENIWHHVFTDQLRVDPTQYAVLLTEPQLNPKVNSEKMIQVQFETFRVPSLYVSSQPKLSLYSSGRITGIVLDAGDGVVQVAPFYESYGLPSGNIRQNLAGSDVTEWLQKMLNARGYNFATSADRFIVSDMKEKLGYVALDFNTEMQRAATTGDLDTTYTQRDGSEVVLGTERFCCAELLFRPSLSRFQFEGWSSVIFDAIMGSSGESDGIHKMLFNSITKCDVHVRRELYANVVLAGGSTMFKGLPERLEKEITGLAPANTKVKIVATPEREQAVWIGGSILASLATFPDMVITGEEYNDCGPQIVHRKCS